MKTTMNTMPYSAVVAASVCLFTSSVLVEAYESSIRGEKKQAPSDAFFRALGARRQLNHGILESQVPPGCSYSSDHGGEDPSQWIDYVRCPDFCGPGLNLTISSVTECFNPPCTDESDDDAFGNDVFYCITAGCNDDCQGSECYCPPDLTQVCPAACSTAAPAIVPTSAPSAVPQPFDGAVTFLPTMIPPVNPVPTTSAPTPETRTQRIFPSEVPSSVPSVTAFPSDMPSMVLSLGPTESFAPSSLASGAPTKSPSPSEVPSQLPSLGPTSLPSDIPSGSPSSLTDVPTLRLVLDAEPTSGFFVADFTNGTDGFIYQDDLFRSTSQPDYASGAYLSMGGRSGGGLLVELGGIDDADIANISGGWSRDFELDAAAPVNVTFSFRLDFSNAYDTDEFSQVLCSVDGFLIGVDDKDYILEVNNVGTSTPWAVVAFTIQSLPAGIHTLAIGGFNNAKSSRIETTEIYIDEVSVVDATATDAPTTAPVTPSPATPSPATPSPNTLPPSFATAQIVDSAAPTVAPKATAKPTPSPTLNAASSKPTKTPQTKPTKTAHPTITPSPTHYVYGKGYIWKGKGKDVWTPHPTYESDGKGKGKGKGYIYETDYPTSSPYPTYEYDGKGKGGKGKEKKDKEEGKGKGKKDKEEGKGKGKEKKTKEEGKGKGKGKGEDEKDETSKSKGEKGFDKDSKGDMGEKKSFFFSLKEKFDGDFRHRLR